MTDLLLQRLRAADGQTALVHRDTPVTYQALCEEIERLNVLFTLQGCRHTVVCLVGDYSLTSIAALIALWQLGNVVALLSHRLPTQEQTLTALAQATFRVQISDSGYLKIARTEARVESPMLVAMNRIGEAGVIIFSSGSTGAPKASVHRAAPLLEKHAEQKRRLRSISFLLFDHIGGLNTLLYILSNGGTLVIPTSRSPEVVARAIAVHSVQTLTTSPTFLNLMLINDTLERHDVSSLEVINYGSEPMSEATLQRLSDALPHVRLSQAYGLTETGVINSRSKASNSNWIALGGPDCEVRVVDGLLEVKTATSMVGYIGLESPFTDDGFFRTGDAVIQDGDYLRIIGRQSDLINIGGEKVYPAEIEHVLHIMEGVIDVVVSKVEHPLIGHMVAAHFRLSQDEALDTFRKRLFAFCSDKLAPVQIPRKISVTTQALHNERFKKVRH